MPSRKRSFPRKALTLDKFFTSMPVKETVKEDNKIGRNEASKAKVIEENKENSRVEKHASEKRSKELVKKRSISTGTSLISILNLLDKAFQKQSTTNETGEPRVETTISEAIHGTSLEKIETKRFYEQHTITSNVEETITDNTVLGKTEVPTGEILDIILEKGLITSESMCNELGECDDGINVGEYFTDEYGFHRQRGFVRTTRIPVFVDWIVEDGVVKKLLPRAHKLVTSRGAIALVPDDFLCELQARYGIILQNYDKCRGYRPSITSSTTSRTSRRKK